MGSSKYADKRPIPPCVFCSEPGTVLALVRGSPEWVCPNHQGEKR